MLPSRVSLLAVVVLATLPLVGAQAMDDPSGDADGLDVVGASWTLGNSTVAVEVWFAGDVPAERAVRGVLVLGTPGEDEPVEWYQFTVANATHAFIGHAGPRAAVVVNSSWTGNVARIELQRDAPAAPGSCVFAVVEAGTMGEQGFVRSDVAPPGFASPETAWPVDECPLSHQPALQVEKETKDSPDVSFVALLGGLALVLALRRVQ